MREHGKVKKKVRNSSDKIYEPYCMCYTVIDTRSSSTGKG